jgi:hypothetical protein
VSCLRLSAPPSAFQHDYLAPASCIAVIPGHYSFPLWLDQVFSVQLKITVIEVILPSFDYLDICKSVFVEFAGKSGEVSLI